MPIQGIFVAGRHTEGGQGPVLIVLLIVDMILLVAARQPLQLAQFLPVVLLALEVVLGLQHRVLL